MVAYRILAKTYSNNTILIKLLIYVFKNQIYI
jgi:hypothetical protein